MVTATATVARTSVKVSKPTVSKPPKVAVVEAPPTIGGVIDKMFDLREDKRLLDAQVKKLEASIAEQDVILMGLMTEAGTDAAKGKKASASITSGIVADVTDWTAVEAYVKKTGYFQLFQRRVSDAAYRELLGELAKKPKGPQAIPGMESFTKRRINLRVNAT